MKENRAEYIRRSDTVKNHTVTFGDIDQTVSNHLQGMLLSVVDCGQRIHVPTSYASTETWQAVKDQGFMRDANGKLILPAIVYRRTTVTDDQQMASLNRYLRYSVVKRDYSPKNQYTRFGALMGRSNPVNEVFNVVMPKRMDFTYRFILWTEYAEQMNGLLERFINETKDFWGNKRGLRFRTLIDPTTQEMSVDAGPDRMVRAEFDLIVKGYLLPELHAPGLGEFKSTTEKSLTPNKVMLTV